MALYFIAGVSGTGKTTLMNELRQRGEEAHDADTDCLRVSKDTGDILSYDKAKENGYKWIYPEKALQKLKESSASKNIFLLGYVDNLDEVKNVSDEFIWMSIPLNVLIHRLENRQKEYGKSERERKLILEQYKNMTQTLGSQTFTLDATEPVEVIADKLLEHIA